MRQLTKLLFILGILICSFAFWWLSPKEVAKRQVRAIFAELSQTVNTNDREAVGAFLQKYLADDAAIQLDVSMSVLGIAATDSLLSRQQFNKESFIHFIDNTLFSLEQYVFLIQLDELALIENGRADIKANARADASGLNHMMGKRMATKWVLKADCDGVADLQFKPALEKMHCVVGLSQEPDLKDKNLQEIIEEYEKTLINK